MKHAGKKKYSVFPQVAASISLSALLIVTPAAFAGYASGLSPEAENSEFVSLTEPESGSNSVISKEDNAVAFDADSANEENSESSGNPNAAATAKPGGNVSPGGSAVAQASSEALNADAPNGSTPEAGDTEAPEAPEAPETPEAPDSTTTTETPSTTDPAPSNDSAQAKPAELAPMADGSIDLLDLWASQDGGLNAPLTIKAGGTYRVTRDFTTLSWIDIKAPGATVEIDFGASVVTLEQVGRDYFIGASECETLTVQGSRPLAGISDTAPTKEDADKNDIYRNGDNAPFAQIVVTKGKLLKTIFSQAQNTVVRNLGIHIKGHKEFASLQELNACGVYVIKGQATVDNCEVLIDHSIQSVMETSSTNLIGFPKAIYLSPQVQSLELVNSSLVLKGSGSASRLATKPYTAESCDNAYGVYSEGDAAVTMRGGSMNISSPPGSAAAIYASSISLQPGALPSNFKDRFHSAAAKQQAEAALVPSITVDAKANAYGLAARAKGGLALNTTANFTIGQECLPNYACAMRIYEEDGLLIHSGFSASANLISIIAGQNNVNANAKGFRFAKFAGGISEAAKQTLASAFTNGLAENPCTIKATAEGLVFDLEASNSPVTLLKSVGAPVPCANILSAINDCEPGDVVRLERSFGSLLLTKELVSQPAAGSSKAGRIIAIDLNGFAIGDVLIDIDESVKIFSSGAKGKINGYSIAARATILHKGAGALELNNLDISGFSSNLAGAALQLEGSGTVLMESCSATMASHGVYSRGIYIPKGSSVVALRNSSVVARSEGSGVPVRGVEIVSQSAKVNIEATTVSAFSYDGSAGAVECSGAFSTSSTGRCVLSAKSRVEARTVFAVQSYNSKAVIDLKNVSLQALCESTVVSGGYWCLMAGGANPYYENQWSLNGQCSFESAAGTHINFRKTPIKLGENFNLTGTTLKLNIYSANLIDSLAVVAPGASAAKLASYSALFQALNGTAYEGYTLAPDATGLRWSRNAVAKNTSSGTTYSDIASAIAAANSGDTIQLLDNCTYNDSLAIPKPIILDMNNNRLTISATSENLMGKGNSTIKLSGAGNYKVCNGQLSVIVKPATAAMWAGVDYAAILAEGSSNLLLDNANLSVNYHSTIESDNSLTLSAVKTLGGNLELAGTSSLSMNVGGKHPVLARAIQFDTSRAATLKIPANAAVNVQNNSTVGEQGVITTTNRYAPYSIAYLEQFYPAEGSELYNEIQQEFLRSADCDIASDVEGHVYNSSMYYATPITLSDGRYIWAHSAPIAGQNIGRKEYIKADTFYAQSYYDAVPVATAVAFSGEDPKAEIAGILSVNCADGQAQGVASYADNVQRTLLGFKDDEGKIKNFSQAVVNPNARITATGSTNTYRAIGEALDMRKVYNFANPQKVVYPPTYYTNYIVTSEAIPSAALFKGNTVTNGPRQETKTAPTSAYPETITVRFEGIRNANGTIKPVDVVPVSYGANLAKGAIPSAPDYSLNGITYKFKGFAIPSAASGVPCLSAADLGTTPIDDYLVGKSGIVTAKATYLPVEAGRDLVTFKVGDISESYAEVKGVRPDYRNVVKGASVSVPAPPSGSYYSPKSFAGWKDVATGAVYKGALPAVYGPATYVAVFESYPYKFSTKYYSWRLGEEGPTYSYDTLQIYNGEPVADKVASIAKVNDVFYGEGSVYKCNGWSMRRSDRDPIYGTEPPIVTTSGMSYYATYDERPRLIKVIFHVDNDAYVTTEPLVGTTTINGAFYTGKLPKPADRGLQNRFRGWSLQPEGGTLLMGAVRNLSSLTTAEEPVNLYALFGSGPVDGEEPDNTEFLGLGIFAAGAPPALAAAAALLPGLGSLGLPLSEQPASAAAQQAAGVTIAEKDNITPAASASVSAEFGQADSFSAAIMLAVMGCSVLCVVGGVAYSARRNRKLDKLDDFFESGATAEGDQLVF